MVDNVGWGFVYFRSNHDFSATEKLVLQLMSSRRARNRFPDNDRNAGAATSAASDRIVCSR